MNKGFLLCDPPTHTWGDYPNGDVSAYASPRPSREGEAVQTETIVMAGVRRAFLKGNTWTHTTPGKGNVKAGGVGY